MNDTTTGVGIAFGVPYEVGQPGQSLYLLTMVTGLALAMLVALQIALAAFARRRLGGAAARSKSAASSTGGASATAAAAPTAPGAHVDERPLAARRAAAERALDARRAHRLLGRVLLVLVIVHPLFYLTAVTRRIGRFAPDKLMHSFTDGSYYGNSLLIGLAGVGCVCAFGAAAVLRRRVPWWHGLVRVGVLLGGWHALRIGSHVRDGVAGGVLRMGVAVVAVEGVVWLWRTGGWGRWRSVGGRLAVHWMVVVRRLVRAVAVRAAMVLVITSMSIVGLVSGSGVHPYGLDLPIAAVDAACATTKPYFVQACVDHVIVFQDTKSDQPHYSLGFRPGARESDVGAIWGLAFSEREHAVYAAATHRRGIPFGAGGPGAVYRIDLATGAVSLPIVVPNAGRDLHAPDARGGDPSARYGAGKVSLGDIDLDEGERELYVMNLFDRRIYRYAVPDGVLLGSFAAGGVDEPWGDDARPWGLAVRAGVVYHGVVNSAENSGRSDALALTIFASRPDGSGQYAVYQAPLDQARPGAITTRGRADSTWNPWRDVSLRHTENAHPMPILSDIGFAADGGLIIGLKDRLGDMVMPGGQIFSRPGTIPPGPPGGDGPGLALGDLVRAARLGDGWGALDTAFFGSKKGIANVWFQGGLATASDGNSVASAATEYVETSALYETRWNPLTSWRSTVDGTGQSEAHGCLGPSDRQPDLPLTAHVLAAPLGYPTLHNGEIVYVFAAAPGDIEQLCAVPILPTVTPSPTPLVSPTPSSTRTPSPTRTVTPTPTDTETPPPSSTPSSTPEPSPIYLPITLNEPRCLPIHPKLDILLVLDASTSMRDLTRAGRPKIDAAVAAARDFLARLNLAPDGDHAGLVSFNAAATLDSPLTADRAALDAALGRVVLAQFTRIDLGLDAAAAELAGPRRRADATAAVVLLTDGRSNPVPVSEAERAAGVVKAAGARLFTIGLGQDVDAEALRTMASQGADYFDAADGEDLGAIYGAISAALPCAPYRYWP